VHITNQTVIQTVIPSQHQFYLIPGYGTWGKKQEKEEFLGGHLAVSSLLF